MKKIFPIVLLLFLIISFCTIPIISRKNMMRTNFELEKTELPNTKLMLLNSEDYLVEVNVILPRGEKIPTIIEYLKEDHEGEWKGYIPKQTKIIKYEKTRDQLDIYFSQELKQMPSKYLIGIKKSLEGIKQIKIVRMWIEDQLITDIPAINMEKDFMNRTEITKYVIYYLDSTKEHHLIPVTKYINNEQNKIEIIIEELKNNIPNPLISYISNNLELIDSQEENGVLVLNLNKELTKDSTTKEWAIEEIANSVLDTYDITTVIIKVAGKIEKVVNKNE